MAPKIQPVEQRAPRRARRKKYTSNNGGSARTRTGEGVRAREGERTRATCSCAGRYSPADPRDSLVQPSPVSKETTSACKARGLFEGGHPAENTYVEARSPGKLQACSLARCARRGSCRGARHPLAARQSSKRLLALATLECSHGRIFGPMSLKAHRCPPLSKQITRAEGGCCRPAPELVWMEEGRAELLTVSPSAVPLVPRKI